MTRTKNTSNPPPNIDYKALYPWASAKLLVETSTLTSSEDVRKHRDEESDCKGRVFARESNAYVSVRPCVKGELAQQAETFKKTEAELIEDTADAYGAGFEDALAQVAYVHPEMDTSPFATSKRVVDGWLAPRIPLA